MEKTTMAHNLDWKIYVAGETSISVYLDRPAEGYWFRDFAEADQFRLTLANDPNLDPLTAYWKLAK